ncbi:unnamed protein product [Phaeothamnion confervicola]
MADEEAELAALESAALDVLSSDAMDDGPPPRLTPNASINPNALKAVKLKLRTRKLPVVLDAPVRRGSYGNRASENANDPGCEKSCSTPMTTSSPSPPPGAARRGLQFIGKAASVSSVLGRTLGGGKAQSPRRPVSTRRSKKSSGVPAGSSLAYPAMVAQAIRNGTLTDAEVLAAVPELCLKGGEVAQSALGAAGACARVVEAMRAQPKEARTQELGCDAVIHLAISEANNAALGAAGACEAVIKALRVHSDDRDVVYHAMGAICYLADDSDNRERLAAFGALEATMSTCAAYSFDAEMQEWCLRSVWEVSSAKFSEAALVLGNAGAVEAVVAAMRAFEGNADVAECGCGALAALATEDANVVRVEASGGIEAVVRAMAAAAAASDGGEPQVQIQGCRALCSFAGSETFTKGAIAAAGGCEACVFTLNAFPDDVAVQQWGCRAVCMLASISGANKVALGAAGACQAVCRAMERYPRDEELVEEACAAIHNLAGDEQNRSAFHACAPNDAIELLKRAQAAFPGNREACKWAKKAFLRLVEL